MNFLFKSAKVSFERIKVINIKDMTKEVENIRQT